MDNNGLLVAVDNSEGTRKALDYVATLANKSEGLQIHLVHAVPPPPPDLQEFGGAEDPATERKLQTKLKQKQARWRKKAESAGKPVLENARQRLEAQGVPHEAMDWQLRPLNHPEDFVDEIVKAAKEQRCGTVIVGRNSFPWIQEIFEDHVGEELARKAEGISVKMIG